MLAVLFGLSSSLCWGVADFTAGLQARRLPLLAVLAVSQVAGMLCLLVVLGLAGESMPSVSAMAPAALGGMAGTLALAAFYRGLAIGTMSIVAPISATGAVVPVAVGLSTGDRPGVLQVAGMAAAVVGVILASREASGTDEQAAVSRRSVGLALLAALGFGTFFVGVDASADDSVLWTLLAARVTSLPFLVVLALGRGATAGLRASDLPLLAAIGAFDVAANTLYALGSTEGLLSVVAVLGSLYPLATVLLARVVLGERVRPIQAAGVAAVLGGVVLIAGG